MLDWNFIASQIATIAFDIVYFGAIMERLSSLSSTTAIR